MDHLPPTTVRFTRPDSVASVDDQISISTMSEEETSPEGNVLHLSGVWHAWKVVEGVVYEGYGYTESGAGNDLAQQMKLES